MLTKIATLTSLLWMISCNAGLAFKTGYVPKVTEENLKFMFAHPGVSVPDSPLFTEIWALATKPSRTLLCNGDLDSIVVGTGLDSTDPRLKGQFKRQQLVRVLRKEKSKSLLVVWFDKLLTWGMKGNLEDKVRQFIALTSKLGYARTLILGADSTSFFVLYDSDEKNTESELSKLNHLMDTMN